MNRLGSYVSGLGLILVAGLVTSDASAFCRMTTEGGTQVGQSACNDETGEPLVWDHPCLSYAIDRRASTWMELSEIETAVDTAFATWQNVLCDGQPVNLVFQPLEASTCQRAEFKKSGNVNTIAFLNPWEQQCEPEEDRRSYDRLAFAVTVVWHNTSTGQIFDADMLINDQMTTPRNAGGPYANCPPEGCPPTEPPEADLGSIVTHEAGHFIGIGHSDIEDSVMFPAFDRTLVRRDLHPDDEAAVCTIYPPGSLAETCDPTVVGGLDLDCEDDGPASCAAEPPSIPGNGGGCSARRVNPDDASWGTALLGLLALTVRRRSARRDERS